MEVTASLQWFWRHSSTDCCSLEQLQPLLLHVLSEWGVIPHYHQSHTDPCPNPPQHAPDWGALPILFQEGLYSRSQFQKGLRALPGRERDPLAGFFSDTGIPHPEGRGRYRGLTQCHPTATDSRDHRYLHASTIPFSNLAVPALKLEEGRKRNSARCLSGAG